MADAKLAELQRQVATQDEALDKILCAIDAAQQQEKGTATPELDPVIQSRISSILTATKAVRASMKTTQAEIAAVKEGTGTADNIKIVNTIDTFLKFLKGDPVQLPSSCSHSGGARKIKKSRKNRKARKSKKSRKNRKN